MQVNRRTLVLAGIALALGLAWSAIRMGGRDVWVLRTFDPQGKDLYTTLWVIDDSEFVWIRANRRDRKWLSYVQRSPDVTLRRSEHQRAYRAVVFDKEQAGPVLGWTSAVAAYGAFIIPQEFGEQIQRATPEYALIGFALFYLVCLGLNWWYYLGPKAEYQNP